MLVDTIVASITVVIGAGISLVFWAGAIWFGLWLLGLKWRTFTKVRKTYGSLLIGSVRLAWRLGNAVGDFLWKAPQRSSSAHMSSPPIPGRRNNQEDQRW